jgi:hypothetical protein
MQAPSVELKGPARNPAPSSRSVTPAIAAVMRSHALTAAGSSFQPCVGSVFYRLGYEVFHTYSVYARGTELTDTYALLDTTPAATKL